MPTLQEHAREMREDLNAVLPNGVGNTIDALCEALDAAEKLIAKLDECAGPVTGVFAFYEAHGCYGAELEALRSVLRPSSTGKRG